MNAEILAVGTELLMGQISNTNAQYISARLPEAGVGVFYHSVVGDNPKRLEESLKSALRRADAVIMTGGLGPTQDDLTKETVATTLGLKLVLHQESLDSIKVYFEKTGRTMVESNVKQAYMPEKSMILKNNNGTAPGCIIETNGKIIVMLPGPPSEMKPMFDEAVLPYFKSKCEYILESVFLRVFGIGESTLENKLIDMIDGQTNPTIATYAKDGEVTLRVTAKCDIGKEPHIILDPVVKEIKKRLGNAVYSSDNEEIDDVAGKMLMETGITLALAESCTGGLVSARITSIPGISQVFLQSAVTYSNQAKINMLGVRPQTLDEFGAVSRETAAEMASGIRKAAKSDIGLSITGIAGPGGGTEQKPVGLVYVALDDGNDLVCRELRLRGNREKIRNITALNAFDMIRLNLLDKKHGGQIFG